MNQFGQRLRLSIFGESHGPAIGMVIDGVPPGLAVDMARVQARLDARRPGTGPLVSSRNESDTPEILSGVFNDKTTGAPLAFIIRNEDTRSKDYSEIRDKPRPGHSDHVADIWSHGHYDYRGGGHYSGRLTACLVAAAAIVEPILASANVSVAASLIGVAGISPVGGESASAGQVNAAVLDSPVHCADAIQSSQIIEAVMAARADKDSLGGTIAWQADGVPIALGDPFFDSVESTLAHLLFSVPAVKGVDFGSGWGAATMRGSQHNDGYHVEDGKISQVTNHAGGIIGGRTTGAKLHGRVAIKPTSSIFQPQSTVDKTRMEDATLELKGRHDPCIAIRAVPVIRACVELVLADFILLGKLEGHA